MIKRIIKRAKSEIKGIIKFAKIRADKSEKIIMYNTPIHGNLGDSALAYAERKFFSENSRKKYYEVYDEELIGSFMARRVAGKKDTICIHAGGYLGTLWPIEEENVQNILKIYKNQRVVIMPQTVYYDKDEKGKELLRRAKRVYSECKELIIFAREESSYQFLKKNFEKAKVYCVPDMVLYLNAIKEAEKKRRILLCMRNDLEKTIDSTEIIEEKLQYLNEKIVYTDTVIPGLIKENERKAEIKKKLLEFSKARLVVTDRLHGMVFCALSKTPCVVVLSKSPKVKGVYKWMQGLDYIELVEDMDEFDAKVEKVLSVKKPEYRKELWISEFNRLKEIFK